MNLGTPEKFPPTRTCDFVSLPFSEFCGCVHQVFSAYRPLPQRYPPVASNGQPVRTAWAEDHYDPNRSNGSMHRPTANDPCGSMRQQYDSPPKPANRVPLQLQVHQEKSGSLKRNHEQPEGSCPQGYMPSRSVNTPRQSTERLTIDCSQRGSGMEEEGWPGKGFLSYQATERTE
ncbi:uncharacterized protein TNCV_3201131 [Trichonephila clavipes]|nr:uncharacterized protein TNCV_3201131 [Trichonephila clavipes]